jgi:hypothetical protein
LPIAASSPSRCERLPSKAAPVDAESPVLFHAARTIGTPKTCAKSPVAFDPLFAGRGRDS